jgi:hypothetical protein
MGFLKRLFSREPEYPVIHNWTLVAKTYAPATNIIREGLSSETLEKAIFGVTSFLFQCENTGDFCEKTIVGSDDDRTEELCEKVRQFGAQTITYNGDTYAIARLATANSDPETRVPIK